jgi:non-ribosomal peptide synthetase component F
VFDGWSRWLFIAELCELYAAFRDGRPPRIPPLEAQYADYALWKQGLPPDEADIDYWRSILAGARPLRLTTDHPLPDVPSYLGASESRHLSADLCDALLVFGHSEGATLYMVLLAAFQLLLSRWSGQSDVTVGTPVANRPRPEFEHLLGCFLNTLAMRTDLSGDPSFRQLVARVRNVALDAFAHQDVPFERLVEELRPQRDPHRHPIFDVMFNLVNVPRNSVELADLEISYPELCPPESRFAFTLYAREVAGGVDLRLVYRTSLFSGGRMALFLEQYEEILRGAMAQPDGRISSIAPAPLAPDGYRIGATPAADGHREGAPAFVAPRTPVERDLAEIWCALLETDRVSIRDNFFDLGGHSLLATQVLSQIRRRFELDLPLRILFEHQTIADLALAVTQCWARALAAEDVARILDDLESPSAAGASRFARDEDG